MAFQKIKKFIRKEIPEKYFRRLKFYYRKYIIRKKSAIFYLSFLCNYNCPYCIIKRAGYPECYPKGVEHSWEEWVKVFEKKSPSIINITGGEPFLYPNLIELVNNIPKKHIVNITTNLSLPVKEFINRVSKRFQITASFHSYEADSDSFKNKVIQLKKAGFNIHVTFVGYPEKIYLIPDLKRRFEALDVIFNVNPYIDPDYKYSDKEIEIIKKYTGSLRRMGFEDKCVLKKCYAGSMHSIILPNGDVYACHAGMYYNTSPLHQKFKVKKNFYLGNIFSGTLKFHKKSIICSSPCNEACDIESAFVEEL